MPSLVPSLSLPEYVTMTVEPLEGGKLSLVIRAKRTKDSEEVEVRRTLDPNPGAIAFGRDLMAAMNYLHQRTRR